MNLQAEPADAAPIRPGPDFDVAALLDRVAKIAYTRSGERLLTKAEVREKTGLGDTELWRKLESGTFPQPRLRSSTRLCWIEREVDEWIRCLPLAGKLTSPTAAKSRDID